jgi:hypothetical protein
MVTVEVEKVPAGVTPTAALVPSPLGKVTRHPCDGCVSVSFDIETTSPGDGELEIFDGSGALIDRAPIHIRAAAKIDVEVRLAKARNEPLTPDSSGAFVVPAGASIELMSIVKDKDGRSMVFTKHGVSHAYSDTSILKPDLLPNGMYPEGRTDVEPMLSVRPGSATVTINAQGASRSVAFTVK